MAKAEHPIRTLLRHAFRGAVAVYFRDIEVVGSLPPRETGGRLFASNHVNGLVDPMLVITSAKCSISPVAKSTLWKIPGLSWLLGVADAVPIVRKRDEPNKSEKDNQAVFERVGKHLAEGGNILIFPEGTSHNEPHLVPLRSGAGRMLAHARSVGAANLTYQAVGLEFDQREVFRSRVLVLYGPVRELREEGSLEGDALARRVTEVLREDLSELLVEGKTWEERLLVARVAELFANDAKDETLQGLNAIGRQVEAARRTIAEDSPLLARVEQAVSRYYEALAVSGTTDAIVASREGRLGPRRPWTALALLLVLPLAIVGTVLYFLPYQVPRLVVRATRAEHDDVTSTYKFGTGLLLFPLWIALSTGLGFALLQLPLALAWAAVVMTSPFAALAWQDRGPRLRGRLAGLLGSQAITELRALRAGAMALLAEARAQVERAPEEAQAPREELTR